MKKIFAMLMALAIILSLATTAFAEPTADMTRVIINDASTTAREINGYKLMTATNAGENYSYEVNPVYKEILIEVLNVTDAEMAGKSESEISDVIETKLSNINTEAAARTFADLVYRAILAADPAISPDATLHTGENSSLEQGYWLFADVTNLNGSEHGNSLVMLDTAGDSELSITIKPRKTTSEKLVDDENDSAKDDTSHNLGEDNADDWSPSADHDIGDIVPYQINVTLAGDIGSYLDKDGNGYYALKIVDQADMGLTFLTDTIYLNFPKTQPLKVEPAGTEGAVFVYEIEAATNTLTVYPNYGYTKRNGDVCEPNANNGGDMLSLPYGTGTIPVEELNSLNFSLSYSAQVNENATPVKTGVPNTAKVVVSNNPYDDSFGETPDDTTTVFTFKLVVDKIDATTKNPLVGADFALEKFIPCADGTSCTEEHEHFWLNHITQIGHFEPTNTIEKRTDAEKNEVTAESLTAVTFSFTGLDAGAYRLVETEVPDGYNPIPPKYFLVLSTSNAERTELTSLYMVDLSLGKNANGSSYLNGNPTDPGSVIADIEQELALNITIENKTGTELPSTGGAGTTALYIAGATLVAFAMVLLITKKRMASAE